jgi:hypothetical protein
MHERTKEKQIEQKDIKKKMKETFENLNLVSCIGR